MMKRVAFFKGNVFFYIRSRYNVYSARLQYPLYFFNHFIWIFNVLNGFKGNYHIKSVIIKWNIFSTALHEFNVISFIFSACMDYSLHIYINACYLCRRKRQQCRAVAFTGCNIKNVLAFNVFHCK